MTITEEQRKRFAGDGFRFERCAEWRALGQADGRVHERLACGEGGVRRGGNLAAELAVAGYSPPIPLGL